MRRARVGATADPAISGRYSKTFHQNRAPMLDRNQIVMQSSRSYPVLQTFLKHECEDMGASMRRQSNNIRADKSNPVIEKALRLIEDKSK
jgi:hypothetical protein